MVDLTILDQIGAIIRLRIRIAVNGLRRGAGVSSLVSMSIIMLAGCAASLGMAVLFGVLTHTCVASGDLNTLHFNLKVAFYVFFILGIVVPIIFHQAQLGIDTTPFRIFPVSRTWLYVITVGSVFGSPEHLLYYPPLVAIYIAGILPVGTEAAAGAGVMILLLFFYIMLGSTVEFAIQVVMRKRKTGEILSILFVSLLIALWLVFHLVNTGVLRPVGSFARVIDNLRVIRKAGGYLPPSLAADAITDLYRGGISSALKSILCLCGWTAAVTACGRIIFTRLHEGERGKAGKAVAAEVREGDGEYPRIPLDTGETATTQIEPARGTGRSSVFDPARLLRLHPAVYAMAVKELRYFMRSAMGKNMILIVPAVTVVYSLGIRKAMESAAFGIRPDEFGLFVVGLYMVIVMSNNICNAFLWEGEGIQTYFLSPAPLTSVIAGKNMGIAVYGVLIFFVCAVTWGVITKELHPLSFVTAFLVFANSILTLVMVGNFLSIRYAVPRNPSRMRCSPSQTVQLFSLLVIIVILFYNAAVILLTYVLDQQELRPLLLLVLFGVQMRIYRTALKSAAGMMNGFRETLVDRLLQKN